jgi:hypothetical protein
MTINPEIRATLLRLHRAYVDALWAAADLAENLPAVHVAGLPYQSLTDALDAMRPPLLSLAGRLMAPPKARAELYRAIVEALGGKR